VDALAALRKFVYEERAVSLEDVAQALAGDFAGQEGLRLMLLHRASGQNSYWLLCLHRYRAAR
jgi:formate C-acetyltransferase